MTIQRALEETLFVKIEPSPLDSEEEAALAARLQQVQV